MVRIHMCIRIGIRIRIQIRIGIRIRTHIRIRICSILHSHFGGDVSDGQQFVFVKDKACANNAPNFGQ